MSQTSRFSGGFPYNLVAVFTASPVLGVSLAILHTEGWERSASTFMIGTGAFMASWFLAELVYLYADGRGGLFQGKGYGTRGVFTAWFALALAKAAISVVLGFFVHYDYLHILLHLDVFPLLTFVIALLRQRVAVRTLEKAQWPINLALVLLVSYVAVGAVIGFSPLPPSGHQARQSFYQLLDLMYCLPLLLILWQLRLEAQKILIISKAGIHFRGADISGRFHPIQVTILAMMASAGQSGVNCRRISLEGLPNISSEIGCTENSYCKPSVCKRYMKIYREVNDLRKRLEQLDIGTIRSPENKRDIGERGWSLICHPGIRMVNQSSMTANQMSGTNPGQADGDATATGRCAERPAGMSPRIVSGLAFAIAVAAATSFDLHQLTEIRGLGAVLISAVFGLMWLLPFYASSPGSFMRALGVCGLLIQAGTLALTSMSDRNATFFLLIRGFVLLLLSFMYTIRRFDHMKTIKKVRSAAHGAIFWILWFYVTGLLVLRGQSPSISGLLVPADLAGVGILFFDRFLLVIVFAYSVGFIMHSPRIISAIGSGLCINSKTATVVVGASNASLLARFMRAPYNTLICRDIVAEDYPDEKQLCEVPCKSAGCPAYQRIYKRIKEVREILEVMDLGDIISPAKTASAKESGWTLCLAEGVYFDDSAIKVD